MLHLVCDALEAAGFDRRVVVTAAAGDEVAEAADADATIAVQGTPLGTGHAALAARDAARDAVRVLIVNGDLPLLTPDTLAALADAHCAEQAALAFLTVEVDDPTGYGRVVRTSGSDGAVAGIVEESRRRRADARHPRGQRRRLHRRGRPGCGVCSMRCRPRRAARSISPTPSAPRSPRAVVCTLSA